MINCACGGKTRVNETRSTRLNENIIVRVRICFNCAGRFNTIEAPQDVKIVAREKVIKYAAAPKVKQPAALHNRQAISDRAAARRRLEDMRDLMAEDDNGAMSHDEMRRELGL